MPETVTPTGHLQVVVDRRGRRRWKAYWHDAAGKHGRLIGLAHVKPTARKTSRGARIWRSGDGPCPTADHLTPRQANAVLVKILANAPCERVSAPPRHTLREALEGSVEQRHAERGLKRSTLLDYQEMIGRLGRDLGDETPVEELSAGRLRDYLAAFESHRHVGEKTAKRAASDGATVRRVIKQRWYARPPGATVVEVPTKTEAERLARQLDGTWRWARAGVYRVLPRERRESERVSLIEARRLADRGWAVQRREIEHWVIAHAASAQTRNKYRDLLCAALEWARAQGWITENPMRDIRRISLRHERERILRREDFYVPGEVDRLVAEAPTALDAALWLCGAHAGLRLPGEALRLRWGAVDFAAQVIRPYDNWVRNADVDTKTGTVVPVPMTPRLMRALAALRARDWGIADDDRVFTRDRLLGHPISESDVRAAFRGAQGRAGLRPIPLYNLRHSFGTALAADNVDVRTISALMRHKRLSTTEVYMAYSPRHDLAERITRALDPERHRTAADGGADGFWTQLEHEVPARWLVEVRRIACDTGALPSLARAG
jgi:integrase